MQYYQQQLEIPEKWEVSKLGDVLKLVEYGISTQFSDKGQYPIFRMNNIENGYMIPNDFRYIDLDSKTLKKFRLEKGDLLFNRTNSIELIGKIGIFLK